MQSINEELETAKEELESSNEELVTVNDELRNRNQELTVLNDDLNNLHVSVNLPILMLGRDLRIRRFTPRAEKVLSLIATDLGRPIGDIKLKINVPDLEALLLEVISTVSVTEREVQDSEGRWYVMRVQPYKTLDNRIDGALLVLLDIDELKQSEATIREARDYAEAIVRTARDPLVILNADLRVHAANGAFYSTFNVSPAESEGRLIYELGNRQWDIPRLRELLEEILPRNRFFNDFEVAHDFETIGPRTMLLNARRLDESTVQPARILLGIQDISELLRSQASARESQTRYQALMEASAQIVWTADASGAVVEDSPSWRDFTGQTYEQWKGFGWLDAFHPEDRERVSELWQRAVVERSPMETEYRLRYRSGEWHWMEMRAVPVLNSDASVREWLGIDIDISERKRAEEQLRQSEEKFKLLFERSPLPKWAFESETLRFVDVNEAAIQHYGYSREEFLRMSVLDVRTPEAAEALQAALARPPHRLPESETCQHRKKGGEVVDVEIRFSKIKLAEKKVWLASINDITERKQAEQERERLLASEQQARQEAEEANRIKDEFLATISHELRTPLNAILGWANMLLRGKLDEEATVRAIESISRNVKAQSELIGDLLDVSRIVSGKLRFELDAVDLSSVIEAALETVRPAAEAKGVDLRLTLDPAMGPVSGDAGRLQQVVWNLLTNAVKYTPRSGHVETRLERKGAYAAITVRDTGEGIRAEFLPYVFARFQQADGTTTRRHGGLGLGLAIVRHLVEAHGGQVRAASEGAGKGAEFTVTLLLIALGNMKC